MRHATPPFVQRPLWTGLLLAALCGGLSLNSLSAQAQTPPAANSAPTVRPGEPITPNFVNAEIEAVAQTLGQLVGRQVVVDPRVKGTISLCTHKPLPPHAAPPGCWVAMALPCCAASPCWQASARWAPP